MCVRSEIVDNSVVVCCSTIHTYYGTEQEKNKRKGIDRGETNKQTNKQTTKIIQYILLVSDLFNGVSDFRLALLLLFLEVFIFNNNSNYKNH